MFINTTETIGIIIGTASEVTTGSLFLTLMLLLVFLVAFGLLFGIKPEYISILILPYCLACMAYYSDFVAPGGTILIYVAFILTKNYILK